jgi:hypothetical protein
VLCRGPMVVVLTVREHFNYPSPTLVLQSGHSVSTEITSEVVDDI